MIDQCSTIYPILPLALSTYHPSFFSFTLTVRLLTVFNVLLASPCSDSFIEYRPIDKTVMSRVTNRQSTSRILLTWAWQDHLFFSEATLMVSMQDSVV
jgi:hypothetical protein